MRRRMGAAAIELAETAGEAGQLRWRQTVAARLPSLEWPARRTLLTVVNAETGEPRALDRTSGVDLVDAVAASTAGGPAYRIQGTWYIDGGYGANADNAGVAAGAERVLVLSPLGGRTRLPASWRLSLADELARLREAGTRVQAIFPDAAALEAFGQNMMNPAVRPAAARAGFAQGRAQAGALSPFWA
jgi:NTE family protein